MNVEQADVTGSDPQRTVPVAKQDPRRELDRSSWQRIGHHAILRDLGKAGRSRDDHRAWPALAQGLHTAQAPGPRTPWPGLPAPRTIVSGCPKHALAVLVQTRDRFAEVSIGP